MEDDLVDLREGVERLRVEACIMSLEGDAAGAALRDRAADVLAEFLPRE